MDDSQSSAEGHTQNQTQQAQPDKTHDLFKVMRIWECNQFVFKHLRKVDLKSLRFTCRDFEELVTSDAISLFKCFHVSSCLLDLNTLESVALNPRLARCVQTLIWNTGAAYPDKPRFSRFFSGYERMLAVDGLEFRILVQCLARFPNLQNVKIDGLDSRNLREWRRSGEEPPDYYGTKIWFRPNNRIDDDVWMPTEDEQAELQKWIREIAKGSWDSIPPRSVLESLRSRSNRALLMLAMAVHALNIKLTDLHMEVPFTLYELAPDDHNPMNNPLQQSLSFMFSTLRELRLEIKPHNDIQKSTLQSLFQRATSLRKLDVAIATKELGKPPKPIAWLLPGIETLEYLGLRRMIFSDEEFESVLLPWCFSRKVSTLYLQSCAITTLEGTDPTALFTRYAQKDVAGLEEQSSDTSNLKAIDINAEEDSDMDKIAFMEALFSETDNEEEDPTWLPSLENLLAEQSDGETDIETGTEYTEWLDEFDLDDSHTATRPVRFQYEEPDDTVPMEFERPMKRMKGREARMIPPTWKENLKLVFSGEDWGREEGRLRVLIDKFLKAK